jgi:hypothetical protein
VRFGAGNRAELNQAIFPLVGRLCARHASIWRGGVDCAPMGKAHTSRMEHVAEDVIAHTLQRNGFFIAKLTFDESGTDLLAVLDIHDTAQLCRAQCKGRSLVDLYGRGGADV